MNQTQLEPPILNYISKTWYITLITFFLAETSPINQAQTLQKKYNWLVSNIFWSMVKLIF